MKHIKLTLALLLAAFLATVSFAQDNKTTVVNHSHPEYEKKLEEIKESTEKANKTFDMAQETYKAMDSREKTFFTTIQIFIAVTGLIVTILGFLGIGSHYYNNYLNRKKIDEFFLKAKIEIEKGKKEIIDTHNAELKKLVDGKEDAIRRMIQAKELDYRLRDESKIFVLYHEDTILSNGFEKVLGLFGNCNKKPLTKLSDILTDENIAEFKNADLVIIENLDTDKQWIIDYPRSKDDLPDIDNALASVDASTFDILGNTSGKVQNQALIINLINKICDSTALIYYGPGVLLSNLADKDKQHLIAFAQAPSTLYSNMMNLLKFKDVINRV